MIDHRRRRKGRTGQLKYVQEVRELFEGIRTLDLKRLREIGGLSQEGAARIALVSLRTWYTWEKQIVTLPNREAVERVCREVETRVRTSAARKDAA